MKALISLSIVFVMTATCNTASNAYGSLSMSLRNQLSHVRRLEREQDKILNDILYLDEMQQSKMTSPGLDKVDRASLGFEKKDTDTNLILQKPGPTTGTYDCEILPSYHDVITAWTNVTTRSQNGESCNLKNIMDAIISVANGCTGLRISDSIALTATHCLMKTKQGICDIAGAGNQVIRHKYYYRTNKQQIKNDIAVLKKSHASASNLNCLQQSCKASTSCKIISKYGFKVDVSLAICTDKDHPGSDMDPSKTNPNSCHTMCVKRRNNESILDDLSGSPVICEDEKKAGRDKWYIRGIMSFKKTGHNDYAMVAMMDETALSHTTCDCPVPKK